jgi:hypothetical protein
MARRISTEGIAAAALLVLYLLMRPGLADNATPYLLDRSLPSMVFDIVVVAVAFGLSVSAARKPIRLWSSAGVVSLAVSGLLLLDWAHFLLFWRERRWG